MPFAELAQFSRAPSTVPMSPPDVPPGTRLDDASRLAAVRASGLLDAPPSEVLEGLARIATRVLGVPIALVSLVDDDRQCIAGMSGLTGPAAASRELPIRSSICQHVVTRRTPLVVSDAATHPLLCTHPGVTQRGVRTYAGIPLTTAAGETLGAFCAIDLEPREWTDVQLDVLRDLALAATSELEMRIARHSLAESEAHYRNRVELSPQVPWTADTEGRIVESSHRWSEITGIAHTEALGLRWMKATHPDDRAILVEAWMHASRTGEPYDVEHRVQVAAGGYHWMRSRAWASRDAEGRVERWYGTTEDIHERVVATRERERVEHQEHELQQAIVDTALDCFITMDAEGTVRTFNRAAEETFGYTRDEAVGRTLAELIVPASLREAHARGLARYLATGDARILGKRLELPAMRRDGTQLMVELVVVRLPVAGAPAFAGALRDITSQQKAAEALRVSEERYRLLVDGVEDYAICFLDANGCVTTWNAGAERLRGYGAHDVLGEHFRLFFLEADRAAGVPDEFLAEAAEFGHAEREGWRVRKDGSLYWAHIVMTAVRGPSNALVGFSQIARDLTELRRIEQELRSSEERYRLVSLATNDVVWDWDLVTNERRWSGAVASVFRYAPIEVEDTIAWWNERVHADDAPRVLERIYELIGGEENGWSDEYRFRRGDDGYATVLDRGYIVRDEAGAPVRMIGAMVDLTQQHSLEAQLRQAQKMEAVGQLAAGVAHDFNNLLTAITGNLEFVREDLPGDHPVRADLDQIGYAADRARSLVRQLLIFSRRQPIQAQRLLLADLVTGAEKLLRRVIGEEIVLVVALEARNAVVLADKWHLEQVLLNLAVNARDAMFTPLHGHPGTGGTLEIEVAEVVLTSDEARAWDGIAAGRWVRLRVRDTGHGMDAHTQARIFEPFYTTKDVGAGTGLGLATVFGIVRQASGAIQVASTPGRGTTFTILLPAVNEGEAEVVLAGEKTAAPVVRATILLVEDETQVRVTVRRILERRGYAVVEARHGADALLLWRAHRASIDAVVTDLRMPEMGGRELVARLHAESAALPVVYVSGYAEQGTVTTGAANEAFVEKPFTAEALLTALDRVLLAAISKADIAMSAPFSQ